MGLTLAMDLAGRGVDTIVLEQRSAREAPPVKCNHVSARSMEIFRRLGVADSLRSGGLPEEHSHDVAFRTTMTGSDFGRISIPGPAGRRRGDGGPDVDWPTPEPPHRINQLFMEPILFDHAVATPGVRIFNDTVVVAADQTLDGVRAEATRDGSPVEVRARFLVGCDGGRSLVRRELGVELTGDAVVQRVQSSFVRVPRLTDLFESEPAWATVALNRRRSGTAYAIDGSERWLVHNYLKPEEADFDSVDRMWALRTILGVDESIDIELLSTEDWFGRRLIADRFRDGRMFLCGDASHIWVPYGGYGLNAGIADAENLGWLLGAHIAGWAPIEILDAYERERRPITDQVSRHAMQHAEAMIRNRGEVPVQIEDGGSEGERVREEYGRRMVELNVAQYCAAGLNFGYFYDDSPLIAHESAVAPDYTMGTFTESTVPGCRLPHVWLQPDESLYDRLGWGYSLVVSGSSPEILDGAADLEHAAVARGVPLAVVRLREGQSEAKFDDPLLLVRPDRHVAWRGSVPGDADALIALATARV